MSTGRISRRQFMVRGTGAMAGLITAMRMFESNQKVLQMQSDRMSREISDLGNPAT